LMPRLVWSPWRLLKKKNVGFFNAIRAHFRIFLDFFLNNVQYLDRTACSVGILCTGMVNLCFIAVCIRSICLHVYAGLRPNNNRSISKQMHLQYHEDK
jgi:hypothetical protein